MHKNELTLCGLAAVQARWQRDPAAIKRLFFDEATGRRIGTICRALAASRRVYRCVPAAELEKVAGSMHHGGIVAIVDAPELQAPPARELAAWAAQKQPLLVLDRVGNAHNLGALARTAAFFGVRHLIIPDAPTAARPNDAAYRVAEGGLEAITVWRVPALPAFLSALRTAGYDVVGAAARGGRPEVHGAATAPIALVLGNEEHGLAPEVAKACSRLVTLPGTQAVESLNVSVAGAVLMWELWARRQTPPPRPATRPGSSPKPRTHQA